MKDANVSIVKAKEKTEYYKAGNLNTPSQTTESDILLNNDGRAYGGYEVNVLGVPQVEVKSRPDGGLDWKVDVTAELNWLWHEKKATDARKLAGSKHTFKFAGGTIGPCAGR